MSGRSCVSGSSSSVLVEDAEDTGLGCEVLPPDDKYHFGETSSDNDNDAGVTAEHVPAHALPKMVAGVAGASDRSEHPAPWAALKMGHDTIQVSKWAVNTCEKGYNILCARDVR